MIDLVAIIPFYISIILSGKEMLLNLHCFESRLQSTFIILSGTKMLLNLYRLSLNYNIHLDHPLWYKDDLSLDYTWRLRVARHEDHQQGRHDDPPGQ